MSDALSEVSARAKEMHTTLAMTVLKTVREFVFRDYSLMKEIALYFIIHIFVKHTQCSNILYRVK